MKTILVIEDEAQTRNIFLKCLAFEGFQAVGASDGRSGIRMARQHQPDLVICDIMMPDMDGYSVLSSLRQFPQTASIPLVFLTAKVTMADLRRGMDLGADDYLTKPCSIEQFLVAVTTRLQRQEQLEQLYAKQPEASGYDLGETQAIAHSAQPPTPRSSGIFPHCPQLEAVFQFIESHFAQAIQLDDVARKVGYSPAYLTTLMQEQTGRTVKQWIIERRMVEARCLLMNTAYSIKAISQASGYHDAGYFSRQFRKFHDFSPQAWRELSVANPTN
jgi:YesN/AraC family two-component response regulator